MRANVSSRKPQPSDFRKILESISRKHDTRKTFDAFIRFAACALAAQTREAEYLEEVKHWERQDLDLFGNALGALVLEMEGRPFEDVLGGYYMEFVLSHKRQQWNGEFHTPKPICDLMAQITLGDVESLPKDRPITVCEPACGAGAMILSLGQACPPEIRRRLRVTARDVSRTACDMTFVNTTLWGIPTRVIHGNSLSLECWAAWSNIHWILPWLPLVPMHPIAAMCPPELRKDIGQGKSPTPTEVQRIRNSLHQQEFTFNQ